MDELHVDLNIRNRRPHPETKHNISIIFLIRNERRKKDIRMEVAVAKIFLMIIIAPQEVLLSEEGINECSLR